MHDLEPSTQAHNNKMNQTRHSKETHIKGNEEMITLQINFYWDRAANRPTCLATYRSSVRDFGLYVDTS